MRNRKMDQFGENLTQDLENGLLLEWSELYALNSLSPDERVEIENYVAHAPQETAQAFRDRVQANRETLTDAFGNFEAEPPAELLGYILEALPITGTDAAATDHRAAFDGGAPPEPSPGTATVMDLGRRREDRKKFAPGKWLLTAAAAVVVIAGGVTLSQSLQPDSLTEQVITANDAQQRKLEIAGGTAEVSVSTSTNAAVVSLSDVPPPPEGKVYQMWRIPADGTAPVPDGTMTAEDVSNGKPTAVKDIQPYTALAITIEPEGGSETPTMPIIATIPLQS